LSSGKWDLRTSNVRNSSSPLLKKKGEGGEASHDTQVMRRPSYVSRRSESSGCRAEQYIVRNPDERRYCIRALPRVEEAELT